ncbi:protein FAM117A-like [Corythoichthys intestinalis]|uniref:protein FAM117A-like n=1 Tax=Corythoichthys intestinalis TaxID=161448 RepID=UPI0025A5B230|nr:protein FAM117A-like [Corythoichthys intestinalis]XP_061807762.1 protein FAM117A-like [Nerophis lumbriciformis]
MSGRSGATLGPQPLKATVPYQLASKHRTKGRDGKLAKKAKTQQLSPGMRRTMSLDAIIGPYLQGHWPKEPEGALCRKDKSTQTPNWSDKTPCRKDENNTADGSGVNHKRSASWGSAEHLEEITKMKQQLQQHGKPTVSGGHDRDRQRGYALGSCSLGTVQTQPIAIPLAPLSTLVPRLRCSVEGLNQELEGMFVCQPGHRQHQLLDVPDGHRAPVPTQSRSSGSQSDPASVTPPSPSSISSSPCSSPTSASPPEAEDASLDMHKGLDLLSPTSLSEADLLLMSSSPGPNKSYCFQREPPEGCEKVRVWEETSSPKHQKAATVSSCPDPNKVNFTPHGGSAFYPLLPSVDLLFCSLSVTHDPPTAANSSTDAF